VSFAYSLNDPAAQGRLHTQYFEIMGSRAIYHDGWMASAFGPREPWTPGAPPGLATWTPDNDRWELYDLENDWSQANDLAASMPEKLAQMKELFAIEAARNQVYPVGGGLWVPAMHPELRLCSPQHEWDFLSPVERMPEFTAPALGNKPSVVTIEADVPADASGVLYKLGGAGGGLTCWLDEGQVVYEYNLFIIHRTKIRSSTKLPTGKVKIEVETTYEELRPAGPLSITIRANDAVVAQGRVPMSAPLAFTANDCLDIGKALGSPVSLDYFDRAPFPFEGTIHRVHIRYLM